MRLLGLRGENFRSFESIDLDLNTSGLIAVVGDNGAGKSTIFNAVEWALYGNRRGGGGTAAKRDGCPDTAKCWVELEFECAGRVYIARREEGNAKLIDGATGVSQADTITGVTQQVTVMLGLDREMFAGTFYARQNEIQALNSPEESKRREQLERLLGIERLRRAEAHAAAAAKTQKTKVATLTAALPDTDALAAEVKRIETAARQAHPAVQHARERLDTLTARRRAARDSLEALRVQADHAHARNLEAQQARAAADRELVIRGGFAERVAAAEAASAELLALSPVADRAVELAAREREMLLLRGNHERAASWRERLDAAMAKAADLADQIEALGPGDDNDHAGGLAEAVADTERRLAELRSRHDASADDQRATQARLGKLRESLQTGVRAKELDDQLAGLAGASAAVDSLTADWHEISARQAELVAQVRHDEAHQEAIRADGEHAACPRCKRSYGADWAEILDAFERDLEATRSELSSLDGRLDTLAERTRAAREVAERAQQLAGERKGLGQPTDPAMVEHEIASAESDVEKANVAHAAIQQTIAALSRELPEQRKAARRADQHARNREALSVAHATARREVEMFSAELASVGSNGYDPEAHSRLRAALVEATKASQRCAALQDTAAALDLLAGRLREQQVKLAEANEMAAALTQAASAAAVPPEAIPTAQLTCEHLDDAVDTAGAALRDAEIQAIAENRAAAEARTRLTDAKKSEKTLIDARREERVRTAVHGALGAFRADASRRARPTLIAQASELLGTVTKGRYGAMQISEKYQVEVFDGKTAYPLKRFSGGEQDLSGLCVRLGLSRMVARQRGVEASFAVLDEVFGSQDPTRRGLIAEQLRELLKAEFRQIFVITHTDDVLRHCDLAIRVQRGEDGISRADGPR